MRIHIVTVGKPKFDYARSGFDEYRKRLGHYHQVRVTHLPDRHDDAEHLHQAVGNAQKVGLVITGKQLNSAELSKFLENRALDAREACFIIGGPEGLPAEVIEQLDYQWSLSKLTFPHDLAMVVTMEALYRASTIAAGSPYHK